MTVFSVSYYNLLRCVLLIYSTGVDIFVFSSYFFLSQIIGNWKVIGFKSIIIIGNVIGQSWNLR